jgi:N-acetylneuraminic acid mutarotase
MNVLKTALLLGWAAAVLTGGSPPVYGAEEPPRVAVLNLETRDSQSEAESVAEELRAAFVKSGQYTVVDRTLTSRIVKEWETQQSGLTDSDKALKVGKLYNVQFIVTGKLTKFSDGGWQVSGVMLDAQSGITLRADTVRHRGDFFSLLDQRVPTLARTLLGRAPGEHTPATTLTPPTPGVSIRGEWRTAVPLDLPRQYHAAAAVNDKIYVIGGETAGGEAVVVSVYDPAANAWSRLERPLPNPRRFPVAVVSGGRIYVMGGMREGKPSAAVEALDPATGTWQQLAPLPTPRWQAAAAESGGVIYVIGGRTGKNDFTDAVEAFDPRTNAWTVKTRAPARRAAMAAVAVDNVIYLLGGESTGLGVGFLSVKSGEEALAEYDPAADRWGFKPAAPVGRMGPAAVAMGRKIYVFGGLVGTSLMRSPSRHYDVYDVATGRWQADQPMPRGRANHAAAVAAGKIYLIGGSGEAGRLVDELR